MGQTYTRQSAFSDGDTITAALFNNEFDQLVNAFNNTAGHTHDGTSGEGGPITLVGPNQDVSFGSTAILPANSNTVDLGSSTYQFKDGHFDGILYVDDIRIGTSSGTGDLRFYYSSDDSYIDEQGTGDLYLKTNGDAIYIVAGATPETMASFTLDGAVKLYYDNTLTLETTATGIDVKGVDFGPGGSSLATNTAAGGSALASNVTSVQNTAVGDEALTGTGTAVGSGTLITGASYTINTVGTTDFTSVGASANTVGVVFTATGTAVGSGDATINEGYNTGVGYRSGYNNYQGYNNTGVGSKSLYTSVSGVGNTAVGSNSLYSSTGNTNTAVGSSALYTTTGDSNVAVGSTALYSNTTGDTNTAVGSASLFATTGTSNTALGYGAGSAITTGSKNVIIGGYTGNNAQLDMRTADTYIVLSDGDGNIQLYFDNNGDGYFTIGDVTFTGDTANMVWDKSADSLVFADDVKAVFGTGLDLEISHDGTDNIINSTGTNSLKVQTAGTTILTADSAGDITVVGAAANVAWDKSADSLIFADNAKAVFGTGSDTSVYFDGTDTIINDTGAGSIKIQNGGTTTIEADASNNVTITGNLTVNGTTTTINSTTLDVDDINITVAKGAATAAAADGAGITVDTAGATLTYASTGDKWVMNKPLDVPSLSTTGDITFGDNDKAIFGAGSDLQIYHDGNGSFISDTGTGGLAIKGSSYIALQGANNENGIIVYENGGVELLNDNSTKLATTSTGIDVTGTITADGLDMEDNHKILLGTDDDLQIYHDGSNSYIEDAGTGTLRLKTDGTACEILGGTDLMARFYKDGASELFYNNATKFTTSSIGVTVNGSVLQDYERLPYYDTGSGNGSNYYKIGTISYFDNSYTAEITIHGTAGYGANDNISGKTIIFLRGDNSTSTIAGHWYSESSGNGHISDVRWKLVSGGVFDIYVKMAGEFASLNISVNTTAVWTRDIVNTSSTSAPLSSTALPSKVHYRFGASDVLNISQNQFIINENSADLDFRIESNDSTHAFFLDGNNGNVGINTSGPTAKLDVYGGIAQVRTDGTIDARYRWQCGSYGAGWIGTPQWSPYGFYIYSSNDTGGELNTVSYNGNTQDGWYFRSGSGSGQGGRLIIDGSGNVTFNHGNFDSDFTIKSDTLSNAFVVDGATGNVAIHDTPESGYALRVAGSTHVVQGNLVVSRSDGNASVGVDCTNSSGRNWYLVSKNTGKFTLYDIGTSKDAVEVNHNGETKFLGADNYQVVVGGNSGSIELVRANGDPFIDFKTGSSEDYDCRIQQNSNALNFSTGGNGSAGWRATISNAGITVAEGLEVNGYWLSDSADSGNTNGLWWKLCNVTGGANCHFKIEIIGTGDSYSSQATTGGITIYGEFGNDFNLDNLQLDGYARNWTGTVGTNKELTAVRNSAYNYDIYLRTGSFNGADTSFISKTCNITPYNSSAHSSDPGGYDKTSRIVDIT